jgi:hypothetical protein
MVLLVEIETKEKKNIFLNYSIIPMVRIYQDINSLIVLDSIKFCLNCGYILNLQKVEV